MKEYFDELIKASSSVGNDDFAFANLSRGLYTLEVFYGNFF